MTDKVTPTQADRDAAAEFNGFKSWQEAWNCRHNKAGDDTIHLAELLARHASQARAEGLAEGKLIGARLMQEAAAKDVDLTAAHWTGLREGVLFDRQAKAIRTLSPADVVKGGDGNA